MPTSAQVPAGTVSSLHGRASVVPAHGGPARPLQVGDAILPGDRVVTARGTQIQIVDEDGQVWSPQQLANAQQQAESATHREVAQKAAHTLAGSSIDDIITAIDGDDEELATAAGFGGGGAAGGGSISQGLRVDRVNESVSNQEFSYSTDDRAQADAIQPLGVQASSTGSLPAQPPAEPPATPSAPVAVSDTARTAEDRPVVIDVLANDRDADGDTLTVTAINGQPLSSAQPVTLPGQGTVSLNADGTLTFTPAPNFNGNVQFSYTVQDPSGASDTGQVQLIIDPLSDTPVAVHDAATTLEDTPVVIDVLANDTDADGDLLSITAINGQPISATQNVVLAGQGSISLNADGTLTFTPVAHYHGAVNFSYTVTDGLTPVTGSVTVNVTPVNDAPVAVDDRINTAEDTAIEVPVRANDRDVDGDALTVTAVGQPAHGSVTINPVTGNPVYTPAANYAGTDSFSYTVSDPSGATSTANVTVTVGGVNDAPTAQSDEAGVGQNGALNVSALQGVIQSDANPAGRDSDPDGDTLTVVAVGHGATAGQVGQALAGSYGTLVLQADGGYSYVPNDAAKALGQGATAQDVFSYTVRDGGGLSSSTTLSITVTGSNDAPVAVADRATTPEDTTVVLHVLDNDSDVDGDTLSITQINGQNVVAGGSVTLTDPASGVAIAVVSLNADRTLTLDPAANYTGPVNFNYTLSDGTATSLGQVSVAVDSVNDGPVAGDDTVQGLEDTPFTFDPRANDTDPEGDPLTITEIDGQPVSAGQPVALPQGTLSLNADGSLTFTPTRDFNGPLSFQYTVSDGKGGTDTATVSISVTPVNDPPVITDTPTDPTHPGTTYDPATGNYAATTPEDTPVSGRVKATDADGDVLSYTLGATLPAHGNVVVNLDGTWTYTPASDYNGSDQFTVRVSDGQGGTAVSTITIGVTPVNDPPVIISDPSDPNAGNYAVTTPEDTPVSGRVQATDADGDVLTYTLGGTSPSHGNVVVNLDGTWTYTPAADYNGSDRFTVLVSDGHGGTVVSTITVGVTPVNDPPVITDTPTDPAHPGTTYDPATGNYAATTPEDTPVSGRVKATDVDGDVLSYTLGGTSPAHGNVVVNLDGTWTYIPAADYNGSDQFTVLVSDGHGGTAVSTITVGVTPVNDPPVITDTPTDPDHPGTTYDPSTGNYSASTPEDTPVSGRVKASDVDGDVLSYTLGGTSPAHGNVVVNLDGTWTYTPAQDYNGSDQFSVLVSDGQGGTAVSTITIGVTPINDPPVIISDPSDPNSGNYALTTPEDTPVSGRVQATDADGDALTYTLGGTSPAHGNVVVNLDGTWTYTPAADYNGTDTFTVLVSDGQGGTAVSTITIGVTPVNDGPVARPDQITLAEDTVVTFDPRANDSDVDGDTLTITQINGQPISVGQPVALPEGTVTLNGNGTLNFTPAPDYHGSLSLIYTVSDGHGGQADSTVSLTVTPVDDVAVVAAGSVGLSEEGLANGLADSTGAVDTTNSTTASGQLSVTDVDGGAVSLSLSGPSGLTSAGVAITWSGSGTAADPLVGTAGGHTVLTASIDGQGRYQVNLQAPVDHPDTTQEDVLGIALTVHADNGTATSTSTLTLQLEDDAPATGAQVQYVSSSTQDTNVMLVIDRSGSMNNALSDNTVNGLKAALKGMLDHYGEVGDVRVQIVTFSDAAAGRSSWLTLSAAKTFIDTITANGGTNYDAALAAAQTAFQTPGKLAGAANVAYFLSDGQPTQGNEVDNAADRVNWEAFLQANHIDAYAVGINGATSAMLPDLNPVAYDGSTGTERPAVILSTTADARSYLYNSVSTIEHGNVSSLAGADGLKAVTAFSAANQTASHFDAATNLLTLELSSGNRLVLNMATGEYTYNRHAGSLGDTFSYTMVDGDGDSGSGTLTLTRQNTAPDGTDATLTLNEDSSHTFQLANFGFHDSDVGDRLTAVRIDTQPNDGQLLFKGQVVTAGQVILAQDIGSLVFKPDANDNGTGYAQVTFSVRDQAGVYDTTPNTLTFNVTPVNDGPIAQITNQGGTLLGLLDVSVNPVLDLSRDQLVGVNDVDNNLTRIDITVRELLSVGGLANALLALIGLGGDHSKLTLNTDFALTHGLIITGNDTRHITIESATPGGVIDVHQVNQLLSTLVYDPAELLGIQVDLLPTMTIHATDAFGATSSDSASAGLITVNVNTVQNLLGTDENDNLIGASANDTIDGGRGNDVVLGGAGHDHLSGGTGDDLVSGGDGNDILFGNDGSDQLYGGAGNDVLHGGHGNDYLHGGAGSDILTGGFGSDVFAWSFADKGTPTPQGRPVDTITDFDVAPRNAGGDVLDLRDLLSGENTLGGTGNLDQFLDFDTSSSPGSTIVHISSTGGFTNGAYTPGAEDQRVVLQNVDLRSDLGLAAASNDNQVIAELMNRGKLMVDTH